MASRFPAVSVLMVARNAASYIGDAILSARQQTFKDIELIVVNDGSADETRSVALRHAALDPRVRVLEGPSAGLAAARNASLAAARGRWAAILDSDDLLHPAHIANLVAAAERTKAHIVAANMVNFRVRDGITRTSLFAEGPDWHAERDIDLHGYVRDNDLGPRAVVTGYLKPLLSLSFLRARGIRYDERLRVAEDYDLIARALAAGGRYVFLPRPTYFYRRHAESTSYRLSAPDLEAMLATSDLVVSESRDGAPALARAIAGRARRIRSALAHARAIAAIKRGAWLRGMRLLGVESSAWRALLRSVAEGGRRRLRRGTAPAPAARPESAVLVIGTLAGGLDSAAMLARGGRTVIHRRVPEDEAARAMLADRLPPIARIVLGADATADDAAYAMAPAIIREKESVATGAWRAMPRRPGAASR